MSPTEARSKAIAAAAIASAREPMKGWPTNRCVQFQSVRSGPTLYPSLAATELIVPFCQTDCCSCSDATCTAPSRTPLRTSLGYLVVYSSLHLLNGWSLEETRRFRKELVEEVLAVGKEAFLLRHEMHGF
jgi:hypothetical protein